MKKSESAIRSAGRLTQEKRHRGARGSEKELQKKQRSNRQETKSAGLLFTSYCLFSLSSKSYFLVYLSHFDDFYDIVVANKLLYQANSVL